jgi:hypothetical protein
VTATEQTHRVRRPRFRRGGHAEGETSKVPLLWPAIAWLVVLGIAAVTIGGHDTVAGTEITVRLLGGAVCAAGVILIAGAYGLHLDTKTGRGLAMVASFLGAGLGLLTLVAQVVNDEPDRRLVLWALVIALSLAAAWLVHEATPKKERAEIWNQLPILRTVVSAGIVLSLAQFWYTSIYLPTTAPASLTLEPKLEQKRQGNDVILQGTVTVHNTSGTRVSVIGTVLDVSAAEVRGGDDVGDYEFDQRVTRAHKPTLEATTLGRRFASPGAPTVIARGPLLQEQSYFEPGETITIPIIAWLPARKFDVAETTVTFVIARSRALALENATPRQNGLEIMREIPEAGWLRRITRGDRFLHVSYAPGTESNPLPIVVFSPDKSERLREQFNTRMWEFYGVNLATTSAVIPLEN